MTKTNIISAALAVASFAGLAVAGTAPKVATYKPAPAPAEKRLSGMLSAGYGTNYDYRGLVSETSTGENYDPIALDLNYKMTDMWSAYTKLGYKAIWDKDWDCNNNESSLEAGAAIKAFTDGLTITPNYKLTHGGWMGDFIKHGRDNSHSTFQSFGVGLLYDLGKVGAEGFFIGGSADYVFSGATGWWYQAVAGYEAKINDRLSAILSLQYNATSGFYGEWARPMGDGDMSYGVKLEVPYKLTECLVLTPYVGTWWLGGSGNNINEGGYKALRNFTLAAGVNLSWIF